MPKFPGKQGHNSSERILTGFKNVQLPKYLGYALPHKRDNNESQVFKYDDFEFHDVTLGTRDSFIEFDGVVLFGGTFEKIHDGGYNESAECISIDDLDLRERQYNTSVLKDKIVIFLTPNLPKNLNYRLVDYRIDLLRRILKVNKIEWSNLESPIAYIHSDINEFQEFIQNFGTANIYFVLHGDQAKLICGSRSYALGFTIADKTFILPCVYPQTHDQAIKMAVMAIRAAREYRERIKETYPEWIKEFIFKNEGMLMAESSKLRSKLQAMESSIDIYKRYKGVICLRSDPLVQVVKKILHDFFDIDLEVNDKHVEDAVLRNEQNNILAVFEIKGVNNNFTRPNINQVDSHRERLSLPTTTPGILIMNTFMSATSLADKDEFPHPDIIKKAVSDNVLLIRTLDLLRCADLCQTGKLKKEDFKEYILGDSGWMYVDGEKLVKVQE